MKRRTALCALAITAALSSPASAHVGSPDVYFDGKAGPYPVLVTVRPPQVIPGVADVEIHLTDPQGVAGAARVQLVSMPLTGDGARFAPRPDAALPLADDPRTFTGHLWIMTAGSWQVRISIEGERGAGDLSVPVPALPQRTRGMLLGLGALLAGLGLLLALGLIGIAAAAVRESTLPAGAAPGPDDLRRGRLATAAAAMAIALAVIGGAIWWRSDATDYARIVYRPLALTPSVDSEGMLHLALSDPGWLRRRIDDLLPDHDHLVHLFVLRQPQLDRVWHLHPRRDGAGGYIQDLPAMPAGEYRLYADIVHETGVPETLVATLTLPGDVPGRPLRGDDSAGVASMADGSGTTSALDGGARMVWLREPAPLTAGHPGWFRFRLEDRPGHAADDVELYMGMLGHAAFVKRDGSVFAHVHPSGSVPMAALALTTPGDPHAAHHHSEGALPAEVAFPYGLPNAGDYRIIVQMKHAGRIVTGFFDAHATP